jgi:hypothetical protein
MSIQQDSLLYNLLLNETAKDQWISIDGKKVLNFQCFPLKTNSITKFSYIKISIEKDSNTNFKGAVSFESNLSFMKQVEDDEESDDESEEINQMTFYTNVYTKLHKCIKKTIELLESITTCQSCNKIYKKNTTNLCTSCIIQLHFHKYKTDCSICYDENAQLLPYTLSCDHTFHFSCLAKMKHYKCPLCRKEFNI